jgi:Ca2+-transporting ATPase
MIVFVGGAAFHVAPISGRNWGISLALGFVSIPLGALIRLAPNGPFEKLFRFLRIMRKPDEVLPSTQPEWNPAIEKVRDGLRTFGNLRGGRLRSSSFVVKSRSAPVPKEPPARMSVVSVHRYCCLRSALNLLCSSALLTMIPTLVVSGVTTNWKQQGGSLSDPASTDPSKSTAALWEGKIEVHPDTKEDDPAFRLVKRVRTG